MPVHRCKSGGQSGWQWGHHGKCYVGKSSRRKAEAQGAAIEHTGWVENAVNPIRADPSKTRLLRVRLAKFLSVRLSEFGRALIDLIAGENALGLPDGDLAVILGRWSLMGNAEKLRAFGRWVEGELSRTYLGRSSIHVVSDYIRQAWRRGAMRMYDDVGRSRMLPDRIGPWNQTKMQFISTLLGLREVSDRVEMLVDRTVTEMMGVSDALKTALSRVAADSMHKMLSPRESGRVMRDAVESVGMDRSTVLSYTEIVRAHAEGQLDAVDLLGLSNVTVSPEVRDGLYECNACSKMSGQILSVKDARGLIPIHPRCMCCFTPFGGAKVSVNSRMVYARPHVPESETVDLNGDTVSVPTLLSPMDGDNGYSEVLDDLRRNQ